MIRERAPLGMGRRYLNAALTACCVGLATPRLGLAQGLPVTWPVGAGAEIEQYLRALSLVGIIPASQWTVRAFGPDELDAMQPTGPHPWSRTFAKVAVGQSNFAIVSPVASLTENSSFPYGFDDGPVWAGRGLTGVVSGGLEFRKYGFSVVLNPIGFLAQNASLPLIPNGQTGGRAFADWLNPIAIDLPQRFGSKSYGRLDPGESHIRWDGPWLAVGIASESEVWGPAVEHPLILGNNAGGIPRAFVGTSAPIDLRVVKVQGRVFWGVLEQSAFGAGTGSEQHHLATGGIGSMSLPAIPGLELGAARFFHVRWPTNGLSSVPWLKVFQGILSTSLGANADPIGDKADNQLASLFFRWAAPAVGFEIYGEYGREDANANFRDLAKEPDHDAAYVIGLQRAWTTDGASHMTVLSGELMNSRISHLQQNAAQAPWYIHYLIPQGHTEHGQVLGSPGGYGGGGASIALDRYSSDGRTTIRWDRLMQAEFRDIYGLPVADRADVMHAITVERMRFVKKLELTSGATVVREFNRQMNGDAFNFNVAVSCRFIR